MEELERDYPRALAEYGIQSTPIRIVILSIINEKFPQGFTLNELLKEIEVEELTINTHSVINVIALFKMHGLIQRKENPASVPVPGTWRSKLICTLNLNDNK